jgi:hypothetical protein
VNTPTHPGWKGTARPHCFKRIDDIAPAFGDLLRQGFEPDTQGEG